MHQYPKFIFVIKPYMFRESSVPIIRGLELQPDSARKWSHDLHEWYQLPCVLWITPDYGHRRFPKHVEFYDKNKFWILMHLVGYFYKKTPYFGNKKLLCGVMGSPSD
jgi:hypothetical protein